MTIRIDRAGRLVVPKAIRERLGLVENVEIEALETPEGVLLRPVRNEPSMEKKDGLWVHHGKSVHCVGLEKTVRNVREGRVRSTMALD
ncbi:MAG TPA: AbrB/MazE/SpoVT family DNA-binding domain-containing protein [Fimbriimonadaceae bacterium]|jgi:AbrB family looped-hinge helix DNA binding protein